MKLMVHVLVIIQFVNYRLYSKRFKKMKAMILAAGYGTRLLPHTKKLPKPLFPMAGKPVLEITIQKLIKAGCEKIILNTHHLSDQIENFILSRNYPIEVKTCYEPKILGTGGAIGNMMDFAGNDPFLVINSDIITDIDYESIYNFHKNHEYPVTLIMHDYTKFNNVQVEKGYIKKFHGAISQNLSLLAFTGIHVIDPTISEFIPKGIFTNIIDIYKKILKNGFHIKAYIAENLYWEDIGSPEGYASASFHMLSKIAFQKFSQNKTVNDFDKITKTKLKGDGSTRIWSRLTTTDKAQSVIMVEHGIRPIDAINSEVDSFIAIGKHFYKSEIPVPKIYHHDAFSGMVFLEDLGNTHLQDLILKTTNESQIIKYYKDVIDILIEISIKAKESFDLSWTYQTKYYDKNMILQFESKYFVEAFLNQWCGLNVEFQSIEHEFTELAKETCEITNFGLMHRDFQSRNIMYYKNKLYVIDFQGARFGPVQYDLASLLIDPYVSLSKDVQDILLRYCFDELCSIKELDKKSFYKAYEYCALHRNMQMLGAFAHLSKNVGKKSFEKYIPQAVSNLKSRIANWNYYKSNKLTKIILENL